MKRGDKGGACGGKGCSEQRHIDERCMSRHDGVPAVAQVVEPGGLLCELPRHNSFSEAPELRRKGQERLHK